MFPRWFDRHPYFEEDDDMAGRRRGPHRPPAPGEAPPRGGRWRPGGPGGDPSFGPPGFGGPGWGGFAGGPNWATFLGNMFGRGPRARRGNVRSAILMVLAEQPNNSGYQIMQAINQRSHGQWRPSSGSIYPTLQQLEDEGLVEAEDVKGGQTGSRSYKLTATGKRYVDDHRNELEAEWDAAGRGEPAGADPRWEIMNLFRGVAGAAMQVAQSGTAKQLDEAKQLLHEVRRSLYRILAEMPPEGEDDDA